MSEKRKPSLNLGEITGVVQEVLITWSRWSLFTPEEKAEILSMLQGMVAIALTRKQSNKAQEATLNLQRLTAALEHQGEVQ